MDSKLLIGWGLGVVAAFLFGWLWYSPVLFAKTWQRETGITEEDMKNSNMAKTMGLSFLAFLVMGFGVVGLVSETHAAHEWNKLHGLLHGIILGLIFIAPSMGINYLYQQKSLKLWLIDAGYQVLGLGIIGLVWGLFYFH